MIGMEQKHVCNDLCRLTHMPCVYGMDDACVEEQAVFDAEVKSRLEREAKIAADLAQHEAETKENFEVERVRAACVAEKKKQCGGLLGCL